MYVLAGDRLDHLVESDFSEAAVLFLRTNPSAQRLYQRLQARYGKAKALSILAHKLGRTV